MEWWVHSSYERGGWVLLVGWSFWVIASIVLHELAHGWAALACGDRTPRELGHMTINPVVHMGWMSLAMFALIGFAWGLMPTDPRRYRNPRSGSIIVAAAGPAMNLALAFAALTAEGAWIWATGTGRIQAASHTVANVHLFLWLGGFLNLVLAVLNLLPMPPLDGSRILAAAVPAIGRFYARPGVAAYGMLVTLVLFFGVAQAPVERAAGNASIAYATWVARALDGSGGRAPALPLPGAEPEGADNPGPDETPVDR